MPKPSPRKNADGTTSWRVVFRVDGKQTTRNFGSVKTAAKFCEQIETVGARAALQLLDVTDGHSKTKTLTLREFTDEYLDPDSGILTGIEPGTRKGYRQIADRSWLNFLGDYPIDAIDKNLVGKWVAWQGQQPSARRLGENVAPKTIKNYHSLLSQVLDAAAEQGHRLDNPAHKTKLPKGAPREGVLLTMAQFQTVLHFLPDKANVKLFAWFLVSTGLRWGEATALTWADLSLDTDPPTVRVTKAWKKSDGGGPLLKHPKSSKARRTVSLYPDLADELRKHKVGKRATTLVFPNTKGNHLWAGRFHDSIWRPTMAKATNRTLCDQEGVTPLERASGVHDLRHTHASWMIAQGIPLPYVQARLGHESITTTVNTYGHLVPEAHQIMADAIGAVFAPALSQKAVTS